MTKTKIKSLISCFTADGDYLVILSPDGTLNIWNTSSKNLFAQWKDPDVVSSEAYSCIGCSFVGKKHRKEGTELLVVFGTGSGNVFAVNVAACEKKWTCVGCHSGGVAYIFFANKGRSIHTAGTDGIVCELHSKTGDVQRKFKASKRPIASFTLLNDEKLLAMGSDKVRVFSRENEKEIMKFTTDSVPIKYVAAPHSGQVIISSGLYEKKFYVWEINLEKKSGELMAILPMRNPPVMVECRNSHDNEGLIVLSISEAGIAYLWNLKTISDMEITPSRIVVKSIKTEPEQQKSDKKNRIPVLAAKLHDVNENGVSVIIAYGAPSILQFTLLDITKPGEEVVITASDENSNPETAVGPQENGDPITKVCHDPKLEAKDAPIEKKRSKKKRALSDPELATPRNHVDSGHLEKMDVVDNDYDMHEPTMGEKLANLNSIEEPAEISLKKQDLSSDAKPPSANSIHVLLKQALHADDRALLMNCLSMDDEKVIANSISLLNPSDILKLLCFLVSIIQSRGGILVCAIPWLRSLLLQHASVIISQESSLRALNSIYQLIDSRVSTFGSALQLSGFLDYLLAGIAEDEVNEEAMPQPVVFEDVDSDEESGDAIDTNDESEEQNVSDDDALEFDSEGIDDFSE